jgi:hypothetical protein
LSIGQAITNRSLTILIRGTRTGGGTYQEIYSSTNQNKITGTISNDFTSITSVDLRLNRSSSSFTDTTTIISDIMLQIGTTSTDYAPYQALGYVSGQNSNGNYVKYDDGRLECYGIVPISYTANTWSNVEKNYPYTFTQINSAVISVLESGNRKIFTNWTSTETKIKIIYTADVSGSSQCSYIAIGRWK